MKKIDPQAFGKVAVLLGGTSAEREVSLQSGALVLAALRARGVDAFAFDPAERSIFALKEERVERVFNVMHGGYGENGALQGALDLLGIRYPGAGVLGSALCMDKVRSKLIWQQIGIPTPAFEVVMRVDDYAVRASEIMAKLGFPLFVKPASEGSSVATARVTSPTSLVAAIAEAARYDSAVLVEQSIESGSEYTLALVDGLDLPTIRIVPAGEFYDYHAKYVADDTQYFIPCGLPAQVEQQIKVLAAQAAAALGCHGWGRIDFMTDAQGQVYFLEINTVPGMTTHSLVPKAAQAIGVDYESLIMHALSLTLN